MSSCVSRPRRTTVPYNANGPPHTWQGGPSVGIGAKLLRGIELPLDIVVAFISCSAERRTLERAPLGSGVLGRAIGVRCFGPSHCAPLGSGRAIGVRCFGPSHWGQAPMAQHPDSSSRQQFLSRTALLARFVHILEKWRLRPWLLSIFVHILENWRSW